MAVVATIDWRSVFAELEEICKDASSIIAFIFWDASAIRAPIPITCGFIGVNKYLMIVLVCGSLLYTSLGSAGFVSFCD